MPSKLQQQVLQRSAVRASTSPKLSRFFGKLLAGAQQQAAAPGGPDTQRLLCNSRLLHSSLRQEPEQRQQPEEAEDWQGAAAGSPTDPLDAAVDGAADDQDPIHSISHIRHFAMLASAAISSVQSSRFQGGHSSGVRAGQMPASTAAAAAASSKATKAAGRPSLLRKPFRPPRQEEGGGGGRVGAPGKQRKPGMFNKFLFTQ
jgi:hypothetical protein